MKLIEAKIKRANRSENKYIDGMHEAYREFMEGFPEYELIMEAYYYCDTNLFVDYDQLRLAVASSSKTYREIRFSEYRSRGKNCYPTDIQLASLSSEENDYVVGYLTWKEIWEGRRSKVSQFLKDVAANIPG